MPDRGAFGPPALPMLCNGARLNSRFRNAGLRGDLNDLDEFGLRRFRARLKSMRREISQELMPLVPRVAFHFRDHFHHFREHFGPGLVVNVSLQQFQYVEPVSSVRYEIGKKDVKAIINADKVVPVLGSAGDCRLEIRKTRS